MFKPASKRASKLRCAIYGASGSGKTFSALAIATGMASPDSRIALIDTEHGSASKYADRFSFDIAELTEYGIEDYLHAINAAAQAGYGILIIDSLSHGWLELSDRIQTLANNSPKYKGNVWAAWAEGTPKQRQLIDAILAYPGHVICTMRSRTEWATQGTGAKPIRVGTEPVQGKNIEYEFDLLLNLSPQHVAEVIKDRTGKFQDQFIEKPGVQFGRELVAWLNEVPVNPDPPAPRSPDDQSRRAAIDRVVMAAKAQRYTRGQMRKLLTENFSVESVDDLSEEQANRLLEIIESSNATQPA